PAYLPRTIDSVRAIAPRHAAVRRRASSGGFFHRPSARPAARSPSLADASRPPAMTYRTARRDRSPCPAPWRAGLSGLAEFGPRGRERPSRAGLPWRNSWLLGLTPLETSIIILNQLV